MMGIDVKGAEDMKALLQEIAPNEALKIARNTVHGVAGAVAEAIKEEAPRKEGIMKKGIKTKRRRMRYGFIRSDVIAERGKGARYDAFYWRFLERGTSKIPARPFALRGLRRIESRLPEILREQFVRKFIAALARQRKRSGT